MNVTSVSFHSEGKWLVTGSEDGTIRIWDLRYSSNSRSISKFPSSIISGVRKCIARTIMAPLVASSHRIDHPPMMLTHARTVNDVCVHPNQGELISCDQAGCIKQWDLSENLCSHELVRRFSLRSFEFLTHIRKTPAGDVPIRSVSLASDGSCLVAGNNKAWLQCLD